VKQILSAPGAKQTTPSSLKQSATASHTNLPSVANGAKQFLAASLPPSAAGQKPAGNIGIPAARSSSSSQTSAAPAATKVPQAAGARPLSQAAQAIVPTKFRLRDPLRHRARSMRLELGRR
jgi:hypothetical protein